jgi:hypothetical protein
VSTQPCGSFRYTLRQQCCTITPRVSASRYAHFEQIDPCNRFVYNTDLSPYLEGLGSWQECPVWNSYHGYCAVCVFRCTRIGPFDLPPTNYTSSPCLPKCQVQDDWHYNCVSKHDKHGICFEFASGSTIDVTLYKIPFVAYFIEIVYAYQIALADLIRPTRRTAL